MDSRQYSGQRRNCLQTLRNTSACCNQNSADSQDNARGADYSDLHEQIQHTLAENRSNNGCPAGNNGCTAPSLCPSLPYVTAYVNPQDYTGLVSMEMALQRGSSFNNLYWPYNDRKKC